MEVGGKALFVKEIEEALLEEKIDVGIHSMKDLPGLLPEGLTVATVLKRDDPRDAFVSKKFKSLLELPRASHVGTGSVRRQAQLKNFRPDLVILPLRGNVDTRLKKLSTGKLAAIILAAAGLHRLGYDHRIAEYLPTSLMLPAVGQGVIGLEIRKEDARTFKLIEPLNDIETAHTLAAERSFLKEMGGDCQSPIAAFAELSGMTMKLTGMVATPDGRELIRDRVEGNIREGVQLGQQLAKALFSQGARDLLRSCAPSSKK